MSMYIALVCALKMKFIIILFCVAIVRSGKIKLKSNAKYINPEIEPGRTMKNSHEQIEKAKYAENYNGELERHGKLATGNVKIEATGLENDDVTENINLKFETPKKLKSYATRSRNIIKFESPKNLENEDLEMAKPGSLDSDYMQVEHPINSNQVGAIQEVKISIGIPKNYSRAEDEHATTGDTKMNNKDDSGISQTDDVCPVNGNDVKVETETKLLKNKVTKPNLEEYYKLRKKEIALLKNATKNNNPYPHKFNVSTSLEEILEQYKYLRNGELLDDVTLSLAGRVLSIRKSRLHSLLYDLKTEGGMIRVMAMVKMYEREEDFAVETEKIKRGDIIGCVGHPGKTKKGDLSIVAKHITLLSPCLRKLPNITLSNGTVLKTRYLDLILNDKSKQIFHTRAKIKTYLRKFLDNIGFLEVETPILQKIPGGALAKPFKTHYDVTGMDYYLRTSPELYLKMLVVGGLERIYEIGRQFRNEEIDPKHNPEYTSLEFYMAYSDYYDLMDLTESLLSGLVKTIHKSYKIKYHPKGSKGEEVEIDFTPPYARIQFIPTLEKVLNVTFPPAEELHTSEANEFLVQLCDKYQVDCPPPWTSARILDTLISEFVQESIVNPTFIIDYPQIMSPLTKQHRNQPGLAERFELYVMKKELCNAYTELNDPVFQRKQFEQQEKDRLAGDEEVPPTDEDFIRALEYGLPPTAGLGLGIDRLVMFLTDSHDIKDVILFPAEKPKTPKNKNMLR